MEKRKGLNLVAALPGDGWKIKPVADLFFVATYPGRQSIMVWKDGTMQTIPHKIK